MNYLCTVVNLTVLNIYLATTFYTVANMLKIKQPVFTSPKYSLSPLLCIIPAICRLPFFLPYFFYPNQFTYFLLWLGPPILTFSSAMANGNHIYYAITGIAVYYFMSIYYAELIDNYGLLGVLTCILHSWFQILIALKLSLYLAATLFDPVPFDGQASGDQEQDEQDDQEQDEQDSQEQDSQDSQEQDSQEQDEQDSQEQDSQDGQDHEQITTFNSE